MGQVCPFCGIDEFVTSAPLGPGYFEYTCSRSAKHPEKKPVVWQGIAGATEAHETGQGPIPYPQVLAGLLGCVHPNEDWVEYGIVEKRYSEAAPSDFEVLREEYGHRILGPDKGYQFTVSAYLAKALGVLRDRGDLAHMTGGATGVWDYNTGISYWAKPPPGPPKDKLITFESLAFQRD